MNKDSHFIACNLKGALQLIEEWTQKVDENGKEVQEMNE